MISIQVTTTLYQLYVGRQQKTLNANPMQLMLYQAPLAFLMLTLFTPFVENIYDLLEFDYLQGNVSLIIIMTGILGFVVNLSVFFLIGKTSAVTYNVISHSKTALLFAVGIIIFHDSFTSSQILGLISALVGVVWYSMIKEKKLPDTRTN